MTRGRICLSNSLLLTSPQRRPMPPPPHPPPTFFQLVHLFSSVSFQASPGKSQCSDMSAPAPSAGAAAAAAPKPDAKQEDISGRVKVKKWNAVSFWAYDIENDTCAICHNALMVPCIKCEAEPSNASDCTPAWGQCSHSYHFHCITRWLKTRSSCPLGNPLTSAVLSASRLSSHKHTIHR